MPFDYLKFDAQCATMTTEGLFKQHKHYTKLSATAMTSTAVSALSMIPTLGLSGLGIAASAPAHHNAKKKKQIVEKYLKARGIEAGQATEYANALAANENMNQQGQNQMAYGNQQQGMGMGGYTGAGPSGMRGPASPPPMDRKYTYNQDNKDSKSSSSSKKSSPPQQENIPPPPPTYDESQTPTYQHQHQQQQQRYGSPQPYGQPQPQQWGSPQGYGSQGGYMSPPPQQGYMSPPPQGYGNSNMNMNMNGNGNGYQQYCGPQAHLYPNSAMRYQHPGVESRHVHFAQ